MSDDPEAVRETSISPRRERRPLARAVFYFGIIVGGYLVIAYGLVPAIWTRFEKRHPALADSPTLTHTKNGIPGDPVNIALVGTKEQLGDAMGAAGWHSADPLSLKSDLRIAGDTVLRRPYDDAPVSNLYLFGRKEDLAFEQPIGNDPRRRHHVRFWKSEKVDDTGRPLWIGAATMDTHVGLSHTTGQITHHIDPHVDAERDKIIADLEKAGAIASVQWIDNFQPKLTGHNGGGDPYETDGRLAIGILRAKGG